MKIKRVYFISRKSCKLKYWKLNKITLEERKRREKPNRLLHNFFISITSYKLLSEEEIESARRLLKRVLKRKSEVEVLVRSFLPRTKKPSEVRMGKGKGKVSAYVSAVCPGQFFFRLKGVSKPQAHEAFSLLQKKLSVGIRFHDFDRYVGYKRVVRSAQIKIK